MKLGGGRGGVTVGSPYRYRMIHMLGLELGEGKHIGETWE
jgi:hypothetical protein